MGKQLTAMAVTRKDLEPGLYRDQDGLYLRVADGGTRGWIFRCLIVEHGADVKLPDLRHRLAKCPRTQPSQRPVSESDPCGVEYANLR